MQEPNIANPYEAPSTQQHAKVTLRSLWRQQLICPHCGEFGVTAGRAFLAHPHFKVRCDGCSKQSRVKLSAKAVKREVAIIIVAIVLGAVVISWMFVFDPFFKVQEFLERWLPGFRELNFTVFGHVGQLFIVGTVIFIIAITPVLIFLFFAIRQGLEHAALHSQLIPVDPQGPANGGK